MGLSRCPRVAWQKQAQNLSMNMLAHTSTENHQSLLYFICYFSCILRLNPRPGHTVQVPYHWPIAPALHNSSSRHAGVGQRDSSEDKGCLLPNLMTRVQFPENQLLTLFSDFHMCHSMYTYAITGARTRAHTHYNLALKCPLQVHVSSILSLACRALWKCVEPLGGGIWLAW